MLIERRLFGGRVAAWRIGRPWATPGGKRGRIYLILNNVIVHIAPAAPGRQFAVAPAALSSPLAPHAAGWSPCGRIVRHPRPDRRKSQRSGVDQKLPFIVPRNRRVISNVRSMIGVHPLHQRFNTPSGGRASALRLELPSGMTGRYRAFTGRLAWLVCGTPRFSDKCVCTPNHSPSALRWNTMVARPGRSKGLPSGS